MPDLYVLDLDGAIKSDLIDEIFESIGSQGCTLRIFKSSEGKTPDDCVSINCWTSNDAKGVLEQIKDLTKTVHHEPDTAVTDQPEKTPMKLYVANLAKSIDSVELYDIFSKFGRILSCGVVTNDADESTGRGYILFESESDARRVIDTRRGKTLKGQALFVGRYVTPDERERLVFLKQFPSDFSETQLQELCCSYGEIMETKIMVDIDGTRTARIRFDSAEAAQLCVKGVNGQQVEGKVLNASLSRKMNTMKTVTSESFTPWRVNRNYIGRKPYQPKVIQETNSGIKIDQLPEDLQKIIKVRAQNPLHPPLHSNSPHYAGTDDFAGDVRCLQYSEEYVPRRGVYSRRGGIPASPVRNPGNGRGFLAQQPASPGVNVIPQDQGYSKEVIDRAISRYQARVRNYDGYIEKTASIKSTGRNSTVRIGSNSMQGTHFPHGLPDRYQNEIISVVPYEDFYQGPICLGHYQQPSKNKDLTSIRSQRKPFSPKKRNTSQKWRSVNIDPESVYWDQEFSSKSRLRRSAESSLSPDAEEFSPDNKSLGNESDIYQHLALKVEDLAGSSEEHIRYIDSEGSARELKVDVEEQTLSKKAESITSTIASGGSISGLDGLSKDKAVNDDTFVKKEQMITSNIPSECTTPALEESFWSAESAMESEAAVVDVVDEMLMTIEKEESLANEEEMITSTIPLVCVSPGMEESSMLTEVAVES